MHLAYQLVCATFVVFASATPKYPVVLVPGYMASQLEGRLNKTTSRQFFCTRYTEKMSLWFEPLRLLPYAHDCWQDNMRLTYDASTRRSRNTDGVTIQPKGFGDASALRYVSRFRFPATMIFENLINALEARGYRENVNIIGAPYDWRKAPYESETWMAKFKYLLEKSRNENNRSAIVVCHSYGCPFIHYFLVNKVDQSWKDEHVKSLIGVAGAWSGHFKSLYRFFGTDMGDLLDVVFPRVRDVEQTFTSVSYMLPQPQLWKGHLLLKTPQRSYTTDDYEDLFRDMGREEMFEKYKDARVAWGNFDHPGTDLHCITGAGYPVSEAVTFAGDEFTADARSTLAYGNGDGRLHEKSMQSCLNWKDARPDKRFNYEEQHYSHMGLITEKGSVDRIVQIVETIE